jgi:hypothetical protein
VRGREQVSARTVRIVHMRGVDARRPAMKKPWIALTLLLAATSAHAIPVKVVKVSASNINCAFNPSCSISATETSAAIPLPGTTGQALLYTRTYKSTADSPAAGRTMYEYRIDLKQAAGVLAVPCVSALTVPFQTPATVDYNGNGAADEQVYVVNSGGPGSSGPASADRSGGKLTFQFVDPVCAGTSPGNGEGSYRFGVSAGGWPTTVTATLPNNLSATTTASARAPIVFVAGGPTVGPVPPYNYFDHSGYIPAECGTDPVSSPDLIDCWLETFPGVANAITWQRSDGSHTVDAWPNWTATQKSQLRKAFKNAWQWYENGLTNFQGTSVPEPPPRPGPSTWPRWRRAWPSSWAATCPGRSGTTTRPSSPSCSGGTGGSTSTPTSLATPTTASTRDT